MSFFYTLKYRKIKEIKRIIEGELRFLIFPPNREKMPAIITYIMGNNVYAGNYNKKIWRKLLILRILRECENEFSA